MEQVQLPLEIQAFIEARVNTAVDVARESLRQEVGSARRAAGIRDWIKYGALVLASVLFGLFAWIFGSGEVRELTRIYVTEHMNRPTLEAAAREVMTNRMGSFVVEKLHPLEDSIASAESKLKVVEAAAERLQEQQRLMLLVSRAEALDREAVQELSEMARGTNEMAPLAGAMVRQVGRNLLLQEGSPMINIPVTVMGEETFEGPWTSEDFAQMLESGGATEGGVNIVAQQKRLLFVPKLVELAHSSKDLWFLNRVSLALRSMVSIRYDPWDLQPLDQWWSSHRLTYTNWPYTDYAEGVAALRSCKYVEALKSFENVLVVDPAADKCRAFGVACAIEAGDRKKADQLTGEFVEKGGRWEAWAKAKVLLSDGKVEQATRELAGLRKRAGLVESDGFLNPGAHLFRGVNWVLFSSLTRASTNAGAAPTAAVK